MLGGEDFYSFLAEASFHGILRRAGVKEMGWMGIDSVDINRPFQSSKIFHFQNQAKSKTYTLWNEFCLHENKKSFSYQ